MTATLAKIAAALTAIGVIWSAATYAQMRPVMLREFVIIQAELEQTSKTMILIQFQMLDAKLKQNGTLEFFELQQYCALARELGYVQILVCGL